MKRLFVLILNICLIFSLAACSGKDDGSFIKGKKGNAIEITAEQCKEKIEQKETFVLVVGLSDCPHCIKYKGILKDFMDEEPLHVSWIVADSEENETVFDELLTTYFVGLEYTPATMYIKDGEVVDFVEGTLTGEQIQVWLNRNGIELE
ncbi:MAG: thioredoxin family protein [Erysipelotrichaceae bacterium]|nr:thioredoxin family protein [Erysipelotrichaceae bacterium]